MRYLMIVLSLLSCSLLGASDVKLPTQEVIVTSDPVIETKIVPVDKMAMGELYIIESAEEVIVKLIGDGVVEINHIKDTPGDLAIHGKFAGATKPGIRVFKEKHLYSVDGVAPGKVRLIIIPKNSLIVEESQVPDFTLTITGTGPRPPPDDDEEEEEDPPPVTKNVSIAIVEDTMNRSPDTAILMNGLVAWSEFVDDGNDWRAYDLTTSEVRGKKAITDLNGPAPGIVIYAKPGGQMIHRGDLPATLGDLKKIIGGLTGG